jgi:hypothetical protein
VVGQTRLADYYYQAVHYIYHTKDLLFPRFSAEEIQNREAEK